MELAMYLSTLIATFLLFRTHVGKAEFSQELYRGVLREDDSANKTVARIIFSGEDSIHLAGVRSDHFQMEELGDGSREVRSVEALEAMEYLITLIALPTLQFAYVQVKVKAVMDVCQRQVFGACSQACTEDPLLDTGYYCSCIDGYTLQQNGYICRANDPHVSYLVATEEGLVQYNTWTEATKLIRAMEDDITALAHSSANHVAFVATGNAIFGVTFYGTLTQTYFSDPSLPNDDIHEMVYDWINRILFFSSKSQNTLFGLQIDQSNSLPIEMVILPEGSLKGLAISPSTNELFWSNEGGGAELYKMEYNSSSLTVLNTVLLLTDPSGVGGMTADLVQQRLYLSSANGTIFSVTFDGNDNQVLFEVADTSLLTKLDVFEDFVYTIVPSSSSVLRLDKFDRNEVFFDDEPHYTSFPDLQLNSPIVVVHPQRQPEEVTDVNECLTSNGGCDQVCHNFIGHFQCSCHHGYQLNADGFTCNQNVECGSDVACDHGCVLVNGSVQCTCQPGYTLSADGTCEDINECDTGSHDCSHDCINLIGQYKCTCPPKLFLANDGMTCTGCSIENGGCSHICTTMPGGFECHCRSGFRLGMDLKTCFPIEVSNIVLSSLRTQGGVSGHTVFTADLSGTALSRLVDVNNNEDPSTGLIYGMEYDLVDQVLFYADRTNAQIWKVPLQRLIRATDLRQKIADSVNAWSLAFDYIKRELYWTDDKVGAICKSAIDTFEGCTQVHSGLDTPHGIVLDPIGKLYWSEAGNSHRIMSSDLDGSNVTMVTSDLQEPGGLTIDFVSQRLYWADSLGGSVGYVGLVDQQVVTLQKNLSEAPLQVAVDGHFVLWTIGGSEFYNFLDDRAPSVVHMTALEEPILYSFQLYGIVVVNSNRRPEPGYRECLEDAIGCSYFCNVEDGGSSFSCSCPPNFVLTNQTQCVQIACELDNGGCSQICNSTANGADAHCECQMGYLLDSDGKTCISICELGDCPDGTLCLEQQGEVPVCACLPDSAVDGCTPVDPCDNITCQNGGTCSPVSVISHSCFCTPGYIGELCEEICPEGTFGQDCNETCPGCVNGSCDHRNGSCNCDPGYTGEACDIRTCEGGPGDCPDGTLCLEQQGEVPVCACLPDSAVDGCTPVDPCDNITCQNGGTCSPVSVISQSCLCAPGYIGELCEEICPEGTFGQDCNETCPACVNGSCDHRNGSCNCDPGYTGESCDIHTCEGGPGDCPDGTLCLEQQGEVPVCACLPNSAVEGCTSVDPCDNITCQNGGTCSPVTVISQSCFCTPGYIGELCEEICPEGTFGQDCNETCPGCVNGSCDHRNGSCNCDPGYTGESCDIPICTMPCQNGGTCVLPDTCECTPTYRGDVCEELTCSDDYCFNDGQCVVRSDGIGCLCTAGFIGLRCEDVNLNFQRGDPTLSNGEVAGIATSLIILVVLLVAAAVIVALVFVSRRIAKNKLIEGVGVSYTNEAYGEVGYVSADKLGNAQTEMSTVITNESSQGNDDDHIYDMPV